MSSLSSLRKFSFYPELILLISFFLCIYRLDLNWFNTHMSRDLIRSFAWIHGQPDSWLGPEMGWDYKRLPGPFYYLMTAFFWSLTHSIEGVLFLKILFTLVCSYLLIRELKKNHSALFVSFFAMQFLWMPVFIETLRDLWNPSLIVAFCCLIFISALKYQNSLQRRWIILVSLIAYLGIQIHFSVTIPFLAFALTVIYFKQHRNLMILNLCVFAIFLLTWVFLNPVHELSQQLDTFYGLGAIVPNRIWDLSYHLSLSLKAIEDYDLFFNLTQSGLKLGWISVSFVLLINPLLNGINLVLFILGIGILFRRFKRQGPSWIEVFSVSWFLIFVISFLITKHKPQMPYRYGLCLYPIQFYLLLLAFEKVTSRFQIKIAFFSLLILISISHLYFIVHYYEFQDRLARAHHTQNDNLELNLRTKKFIYSLQAAPISRTDPFMFLHGRSMNKMRLKEMNWPQTTPYFGLYEALTGHQVQYSESIIEQDPQSSWLFQLRNLQELGLNPQAPFLLTELKVENLPQNLVIKYLDERSEGIEKIFWKNSNLILPLAFLSYPVKTKILHLEFNLDSTENKFLNLLIDDNATYRFAYKTIYKLLQVKINGKVQAPIETHKGYFLVQNQYIYKIKKDIPLSKVVIELKIETDEVPNYSRLDLFTSPIILPPEELEN